MHSVDIAAEDLDLVTRFVLRLGGYAEGMFDYNDFGFSKDVLRGHITQLEDELRRMRETIRSGAVNLRPPNLPMDAVWEEVDDTMNYGQTIRFAAGAAMIVQNYRDRMTADNLRRSIIAKILHQCQAGILDDLVDQGKYTFIEAKDLYHHCLASSTDPGFDINTFRRELALMLKQEQLGVFDLLTNITAAFNRLYQESPNGPDLFYEMQRIDERVILGQALAMFQKSPTLDVSKLKRICSAFYAPDSDLRWHERLSSYVAGVTHYNLIDMCFMSEPMDRQELDRTLKAWYYYDLVIARLNHIVGVHKDLRSGNANLALIAMREPEVAAVTNLMGYNANLTIRDYEDHFSRTAEFSRRAVRNAMRGVPDGDMFYPFISLMIPVVMMADWIGNRDNMIHTFMRLIAPGIRDAAKPNGHAIAEIAEAIATRST